MIYYLLVRQAWEEGRDTDPVAEVGDEGFVHCCDERQIEAVRRIYFASNQDVLALEFDPTQLDVETRYEPGSGGEAERFPHAYGALRREAVKSVRPL